MSHRSRTAGVLVISSAALVPSIGGIGVAQADPTLPASVTALLDSGSAALGSSAPAPDAPRLASIDNFRDVAGTGPGYTGLAGRHVNKGLFYRANAIVPNDADLATLTGLKLSTVFDLRTDYEVTKKPDVLPGGVTYTRLPIGAGDYTTVLSQIKSVDDSRAFMQAMNRQFVTGEDVRTQFGTMLTDMATATGPVVFHCTGGKDRTGWTSYLLLSIAGVDSKTIMDDYLLTNEYTKDSIAASLATLHRIFGDAAANMAPLVGVEPSFLQAGIDQLTADYGTVDRYLTEGLKLSPQAILALKAKLLG
ncbi:tyrosine-protein phosphatase [Rhodococcus spelaei]|uniref:Tyrosine-protein phosphatase n=1 Tax=Rhodococcus spelaei TaxID=2546320 RepID=A0A541B296_9NOCA|nr:tyrosine-protein phosphatase [Rhodococcus spelaei]TQF66439.1 tyrosine-protein phosphatase [Rhodococcus spelaei]